MSAPRRIAVDVREWKAGSSTGIGRFLTGFLEWTSRDGAHRLLLIGNQHTEERVVSDRGDERWLFERLPERSRLAWDQITLPGWLRRHGADVFLSPYYKVPLRAPCPVVATIHDLIPLHYPRPGEGGLRRTLVRRWMRIMLARAARIVTDSAFSRRDVARTLAIDDAAIDVVPLRVEPAFATPPAAGEVAATLHRLGLPAGYVLYVGRFDPHKNVGLLLRAWEGLDAPLRAAHPLVLAGRGGEALASGAAGVRALGFVADDELAALYAGAALFAFPSLYEGFGLPPLEAMGCGTPVVCSDAASLPEVVGDAALLCPPGDVEAWTAALRALLTDPAARTARAAAGRARAARFTTEATAPLLLDVLLRAAGAAPARGAGRAAPPGGTGCAAGGEATR